MLSGSVKQKAQGGAPARLVSGKLWERAFLMHVLAPAQRGEGVGGGSVHCANLRHIEVRECLAALCEELQQRRLPPHRLSGGLLHGRQG